MNKLLGLVMFAAFVLAVLTEVGMFKGPPEWQPAFAWASLVATGLMILGGIGAHVSLGR